jgi:site-specific DNA-methyltransferase (cytosine-N4-specific)
VVDPRAQLLIDPFCGSGTSLVEAIRLGINAHGIDLSPIATYVSAAKIQGTTFRNLDCLKDNLAELGRETLPTMKEAQENHQAVSLPVHLSANSIEYLQSWFTPGAFAAISVAASALNRVRRTVAGRLARVALSSVLRDVSLQLPEDLRVRRRREPFEAPPVWEALQRALERVESGLEEIGSWDRSRFGSARVVSGSAVRPSDYRVDGFNGRRLILTSPPYATALPYIDTDRLSIVLLGLADAADIAKLERSLSGSREWSRATEAEWNRKLDIDATGLPGELTSLLHRIRSLNAVAGAGFRRKAVPALLYRYFTSMAATLDCWARVLRRGEHAVVIVGDNKTRSGDTEIEIPTPHLLAQVAAQRGFFVEELISLDAWPRYGLHAHNGVKSEHAVVLTRSG